MDKKCSKWGKKKLAIKILALKKRGKILALKKGTKIPALKKGRNK